MMMKVVLVEETRYDITNLIIQASWANSVCIFSFKCSARRTLIATSWLRKVPLYLHESQSYHSMNTHKQTDHSYKEWKYSQVTKWDRRNFLFILQQACINFPDIDSASGCIYIIRDKLDPSLLLLPSSRNPMTFQPRLLLLCTPRYQI